MPDAISVIVNRMVGLISGIDDIGLVHAFDPRDRKDVRRLLIADVDGVRRARAWWISGPTMRGRWLTAMSPRHIHRTWAFDVHGIEGAREPDDLDGQREDIQLVRDFAVAVSDALDSAVDLSVNDASKIFAGEPCEWRQPPRHEPVPRLGEGLTTATVVVEKRIVTMPSKT